VFHQGALAAPVDPLEADKLGRKGEAVVLGLLDMPCVGHGCLSFEGVGSVEPECAGEPFSGPDGEIVGFRLGVFVVILVLPQKIHTIFSRHISA